MSISEAAWLGHLHLCRIRTLCLSAMSAPTKPKRSWREKGIGRFLSILGPGLITGAADDDPSGIATCSMAGAQQGTTLLWTALITWPLMGCVQMMCARIGMVTGRGLAGTLRMKFPVWVIALASLALFVANTINIGADLAGMADSVQMLTNLNGPWFVPILAVSITMAVVCLRYERIANILKWLALSLLAYVVTGIICRPPWGKVLWQTIVPTWPKNHEAWATLVALLGTTISPYLFYWQSSLEVEEKKAKGQKKLAARRDASSQDLWKRRVDVAVGTFASQLVSFFIILTTAITLHANGTMKVETSRQAAEALRYLFRWRFCGAACSQRGSLALDCWPFRRWRVRRPMPLPRHLPGVRDWMNGSREHPHFMRSSLCPW